MIKASKKAIVVAFIPFLLSMIAQASGVSGYGQRIYEPGEKRTFGGTSLDQSDLESLIKKSDKVEKTDKLEKEDVKISLDQWNATLDAPIPAPSEKDVKKVLNLREVKINFGSADNASSGSTTAVFIPDDKSKSIIKRNLLKVLGVSTSMRRALYNASTCGKREYEVVVVPLEEGAEKKEWLSFFYPCSGSCSVNREVENGKTRLYSKLREIDSSVCKSLWQSGPKIVDFDGP
jgi:hypothetical protein